ncbi:MAG: DNA-binding response regulator [Variovorax sp.]
MLVVDDSPAELRLLLEALRGAQFQISVAFDGMQGYGRAVAQLPDLILMDVRMGRTDGFAACRLLKADPITAHIPLIFLTGSGSLDDRLTGLSEGAVDYIIKPFEPAEVLARVRAHLRPAARRPVGGTDAVAAGEAHEDRHEAEGADNVLVQAAVRQVEAHLAHMPSLAELARRVGTHEKRLTRAFREQTGLSVFEFVRERRLALARRLLTQTPLGIGDIAVEAGFSSAANFATAFRAEAGVSPTEYRQRQLAVRPASPE